MLWRHKIFYKGGYEESFGEDIRDISPTPELITPTTIYAPVVTSLLKDYPILGMAHITGGGIPGNLPRCIPDGLEARVNYDLGKCQKSLVRLCLLVRFLKRK